LHEIPAVQSVTIDGKTLRRSSDAAGSKSAIHMVAGASIFFRSRVTAWQDPSAMHRSKSVENCHVQRSHSGIDTRHQRYAVRIVGIKADK